MNNPRQTTLFQSWGKADDQAGEQHLQPNNGDDVHEDDDILLAACQEWETSASDSPGVSAASVFNKRPASSMPRLGTTGSRPQADNPQFPPLPPHGTPMEDLPGFDPSMGNLWIYPTNYPVRDYQYNIVQQALFKNTMVTLPTGLGKTFIAAVVMYNFYRWYPQGKVVFMAPTKPLVAQQIEACYKVMGIPQSDMQEMTGQMHASKRKLSWASKRVFFLTPQVLMNDLSRLTCPADDIKCLVVDEAHKALGNHSYCQVVNELCKYTLQFRILALSATPGSDLKAVQTVLQNLRIAHIEIRSEDSIDIKPYAHERKVEKVVVPLGEELKYIRDNYLQILMVYTQRLNRVGVLYKKDPALLTKFEILRTREGFRQDPPQQVTNPGVVEGDFAICISLYHGYELLMQHGMRSLYNFLQATVDPAKGFSRTKQELQRNGDFRNLMETLQDKFPHVGDTSLNGSHANLNSSRLFTSPGKSTQRAPSQLTPFVLSHPKMERLQDVVVDHFKNFKIGPQPNENQPTTSKATSPSVDKTRVMIFAQYRDSTQEISEMLNRHRPLIRCMSFIGQSSAGKNTKGFSQKEQLRVVREFREGGYNTLVSTCVGEEGLDIGDVDLIVCYDAHKSPIRLVQRMGRTGRKRQGRIVMLVTEGKEAAVYDKSQFSKRGIHRALQGNSKSLQLYTNSPRMVPRGLNPQPHKMFITIAEYKTKQMKDKKGGGGGKNRTSGILNYVKPITNKPADRCFLSSDELAQWSMLYQVHGEDTDTVQAVPEQGGHFVSLKKAKPSQEKKEEPKSVLSLNQWSLWQNKRQTTVHIDHSARTMGFVEVMQFIELQAQIGYDDDPYGLEMQTYLDEEDIIKPKKAAEDVGIRRFCQTAGGQQRSESPVKDWHSDEEVEALDFKESQDKIKGRLNKVAGRKKRTLAAFSDDEVVLSSDEDLPDVDLEGKQGPPKSQQDPSRSPVFEEQESDSAILKRKKSKAFERSKSPVFGSQFVKDGKERTEGIQRGVEKGAGKETKKPYSKKKAKRKPVVIESSEDDDFEVDQGKKKVSKITVQEIFHEDVEHEDLEQERVRKSPVQKILTILGCKDDANETSGDDAKSDFASPMDTGEDTVPSSDDEPLSPTFEKVARSQVFNTSIGNTLDGSKLSLTANLSNFFPNCSQVVAAQKPEQPVRMEERAVTRSVIPPPPPSVSSLDLLDDLNLSLNTTVDLDFLTAPVLSMIKISTNKINPSFGNKRANEEELTNLLDTDNEIGPSEGKDAFVKSKHSISKFESFPNKLRTEKDDFVDEQQIDSKWNKNVMQTANDNNTIDHHPAKRSEECASTEGNVADGDLVADISFTLGDDLFDDDQEFEDLPVEENSKENKVEADLGTKELKESRNSQELDAECTIDPVPFEFQTPTMVNRTIAGIRTATRTSSSLKNKCSSKSVDHEESIVSVLPASNLTASRVVRNCDMQRSNFSEDFLKADVSNSITPGVDRKSEILQDDEIGNTDEAERDLGFTKVSPVVKSEYVDSSSACTKNGRASPVFSATKAVMTASKPVMTASKPVVNASKPVMTASKPVVNASKPVMTASKPVKSEQRDSNVFHAKDLGKTVTDAFPISNRSLNASSVCSKNDLMSSVVSASKPAIKSDTKDANIPHSKNLGHTSANTSSGVASKMSNEDKELAIPQFDLGFDLEPQFDLDFDLDTLDDSALEAMDIVPPSPNAVRQHEYISQSQHTRGSFNQTSLRTNRECRNNEFTDGECKKNEFTDRECRKNEFRDRECRNNEFSLRTFNTPSMLQFRNDAPDRPKSSTPLGGKNLQDRPSSSTPLQGDRMSSRFPVMESDFVSPITSRVQSNQSKNSSIDEPSPSLLCPGGSVDPTKDQRSSFCRIRPLFKSGGLTISKEVNVQMGSAKTMSLQVGSAETMSSLMGSAKRKSSSPLFKSEGFSIDEKTNAEIGSAKRLSSQIGSAERMSSLIGSSKTMSSQIRSAETMSLQMGSAKRKSSSPLAPSGLQENASKRRRSEPQKKSSDVKDFIRPEDEIHTVEEVQLDCELLEEVDIAITENKSSSSMTRSGEYASKRRNSVSEKRLSDVTDSTRYEDAIETVEDVQFDFELLEEVDIGIEENMSSSSITKSGENASNRRNSVSEKRSPDVTDSMKPEESIQMAEEVQFDFGLGMLDDQSMAEDESQDEDNPHRPVSESKVTPGKPDSDSEEDDDIPAFRKRKKSAALPSPTTPTFKTPGKPPRKLSRLSTKGSKNRNSLSPKTTSNPATKCEETIEISKTTSSTNLHLANTSDDAHKETVRKTNQDHSSPAKKVLPLSERISNKKTVRETRLDSSPLAKKSLILKDKISKDRTVEQTILKSPLRFKNPLSSDSDSDEDVVPVGKKRRRAMALMSPLSQVVKSPEALLERLHNRLKKPGCKMGKITTISSDEESPIVGRRKKILNKPIVPRIIIDDDDDDDFEDQQFTKVIERHIGKKSSSSSDDVTAQRLRDRRRKKKKGSKRTNYDVDSEVVRGFLDNDAEVSGDDVCSSDESGSDLDDSLDGFIASQLSQQTQAVNQSDMHAIYMKSVRSPEMNNRFKMMHGRNQNMDIFSQVPVQDESYYEDSFVVAGGEDEEDVADDDDDDVVDDVPDESLYENTINMDNILRGERRRRGAKESKAEKILKRGRRKILSPTSSSSDDDITEVVDVTDDRRHAPIKSNNRNGDRTNSCYSKLKTCNSNGRTTNMGQNESVQNNMSKLSAVENRTALRTNLSLMNSSSANVRSVPHNRGDNLTRNLTNSSINSSNAPKKQADASRNLNNFSNNSRTAPQKQPENDSRNLTNSSNFQISLCVEQNETMSRTSSSSADETSDKMTLQEKQKAERLKKQQEQQRLFRIKMEEKKRKMQQEHGGAVQTRATESPRVQQDSFHNVQSVSTMQQGSSASSVPTMQQGNLPLSVSTMQQGSSTSSVPTMQQGSLASSVPTMQQGSSTSSVPTMQQRSCRNSSASAMSSSKNLPMRPGDHGADVSSSVGQKGSRNTNGAFAMQERTSPLAGATLTSPLTANQQKQLTVLIDSKELASSSHIVSTLKLQHKLNAVVCQLNGCDFIVSNRMGVEKKKWSDFINGANRTKLVDRMRHLCELFDRPCLIVEKDRVKPKDDKKPKKLVRTKYLDSTLANLAMSHIKVLFSESNDDTARILSELAKAESAKGMAIPPLQEMEQSTEQVLKFYQSIPRVSYPLALTLYLNFSSVQDVIRSSIDQLQRRGKMSEQRARDLHRFLRHKYDEQMTGGVGR